MNLKKLVKFLGLGLALALLALAGENQGQVGMAQQTFTVCPSGCDFTSIQKAIDAVPENSIILVKAGTYKENPTIFSKSLRLSGEGSDKTILEGTLTILATKSASVMDFMIKGGKGVQIEDSGLITLSNNALLESNSQGLFVRSSSIVLRENLISRNKTYGLLTSETKSLITNNQINENDNDGIKIISGKETFITDNTVTGNGGDGVDIISSQASFRDNTVLVNTDCGIRVDAASTITGNVTLTKVNGNRGGNLCEKALVLDNEPPAAPLDLTVSPSDWTNQPIKVDWTNPDELTAITAAWYKIGSEPTKPDDGQRFDKKPLVLTSPVEGEQPIYLWLEDLRGNKSHQNQSQGTLRFDETPPTGWLTINDGAKITTSLIVTLKIQAEDKAGYQPGSGLATMRFSNDGQIWSDWEEFQNVRSNWDLSHFGGSTSLGPKTVYAQLGDWADNESGVFKASIDLIPARDTLTGHTDYVESVAFSPDGKLLASGSYDNTIKLWYVGDLTGR